MKNLLFIATSILLLAFTQNSGVSFYSSNNAVKYEMDGGKATSVQKIDGRTEVMIDTLTKAISISFGTMKEHKTLSLIMDSNNNGVYSIHYYIKESYNQQTNSYSQRIVHTPSQRNITIFYTKEGEKYTCISFDY